MTYSLVLEKITEASFPPGYYQAYIPRLGLATHGLGIEGARTAALELVLLWIAEKRANREDIPTEVETMFTTIQVPEDALQSA
jgi:hypothetical protein